MSGNVGRCWVADCVRDTWRARVGTGWWYRCQSAAPGGGPPSTEAALAPSNYWLPSEGYEDGGRRNSE